ncbi:MAG: hypothetical protein WAP55_03490 [Minisyncoccia bacterium]
MQKIKQIFLNTIPVLIMIGLIPLIINDYLLTGLYIAIILTSFLIKKEPKDIFVFGFGFVVMIIFEYLFIKTGVEIFNRNTLLGVMPLWLPFLWGYGFVVIKRSVLILNT